MLVRYVAALRASWYGTPDYGLRTGMRHGEMWTVAFRSERTGCSFLSQAHITMLKCSCACFRMMPRSKQTQINLPVHTRLARELHGDRQRIQIICAHLHFVWKIVRVASKPNTASHASSTRPVCDTSRVKPAFMLQTPAHMAGIALLGSGLAMELPLCVGVPQRQSTKPRAASEPPEVAVTHASIP